MKLAIVCHAHFGGSGVLATELGLHLAARGHQVHFVCAKRPPRLKDVPNVTLHEVASPLHPLLPGGEYALALASTLRGLDVELVHVHYAIPLAVSAVLARAMGATWKLVTTVHGTDVLTLGREPAFAPAVEHALRMSDRVTAPSAFLSDQTQRTFGVEAVQVVPNFIDPGAFVPAAPERRTPVVLHNSNFRSLKRIDDLIRIFAKVRSRLTCQLSLLGDGPERAAAQALVRDLQLGDAVQFHGEQTDIGPFLHRAAVFVMPSEVESFGLAALEAMACGIPVVATRVGGVPEVVEHGTSGFLRPVGDVAAMADDVVALLSDPSLHARMSSAARARALHFRAEPIVDAWEDLYRTLT